MKKLLVTAIGAAAAFGAVAGTISTQRFENVTGELPLAQTISDLNTLAGGTYWSGDELTNTYKVVSRSEPIHPQAENTPMHALPTKALEVKTTFGSPLKLNAVSGGSATNIPASGIYFDSLVKFTVCEEEPDQSYADAKIIMWLQEQCSGDTITGTNIMVRANYINADGTFTPTTFTCYPFTEDINKWHRVTIKTWADITKGSGIPGFVIFINNEPVNVYSGYTMADAIAGNLTEAAGHFGKTKVFASLVQGNAAGKSTITSASFDGTGALTDLVFTDEAPFEAAEDWIDPQADVKIDGEPVPGIKTLAQAVSAVNGASEGQIATLSLSKGMTLDGTLTFASEAEIVLDFAGFVLTNDLGVAAITNSAYLVVTNSVGDGGITGVSAGSSAIYQIDGNGQLDVYGGVFRADIEGFGSNLLIAGGSFQQDADAFAWEDPVTHEVISLIEAGKMLQENQTTGLYDVVDYVPPTYTVKFISGEGSTTNDETGVAGTVINVPAPAAVVGKSFSAWDPAIAGATVTISADATYTAQYTNNIYTITFVIGESSSSVQKAYGSEITSAPEIPVRAGYTGAWDDDPAGDTVTGDKTYTYTYSAQTYTIEFVNEIGADPASTNYTIVSGEITLPTATTENTGVQFDGWTNATITTAIKTFNPTAENVGNFTLYAAWSSTGTGSFDGGDGNSFTIDPGTVATVEAAIGGGKKITDTVAGTDMTYAQAYALGLVNESTGAVDELDATIEMKGGKVVVGLSSTPSAAYTITLKVYEKASLTDVWPSEPTQTYTIGSETATTGFEPGSAGAGFYKTEVTISNK